MIADLVLQKPSRHCHPLWCTYSVARKASWLKWLHGGLLRKVWAPDSDYCTGRVHTSTCKGFSHCTKCSKRYVEVRRSGVCVHCFVKAAAPMMPKVTC